MPESRDTRQQRLSEPKASWSPLAKAVFTFGISDDFGEGKWRIERRTDSSPGPWSRQVREDRLVNVVHAECRLIFAEALVHFPRAMRVHIGVAITAADVEIASQTKTPIANKQIPNVVSVDFGCCCVLGLMVRSFIAKCVK